MNLNEYQKFARLTAVYPKDHGLVYCALGLTGESGEVADKLKKVIRDQEGVMDIVNRGEIAKELGDVLWYVANLSYELGYDLNSLAQLNINKLANRHERGVIQGEGDNR